MHEALAVVLVLREHLRKRRSTLLRFLLHSEYSLTKPKATILAPDCPKPSEATEGSGYESTPSCPSSGAAREYDGCSGPATIRELRKRTFQKPIYSGHATDESEGGRRAVRLLGLLSWFRGFCFQVW